MSDDSPLAVMSVARVMKAELIAGLSAIDEAMTRVENALEAIAVADALRISRRNVGKDVVFVAAMGSWFIGMDDGESIDEIDEDDTPSMREFSNVERDYGVRFLPSSVRVTCRDGRVISRETEW